MSQRLIGLTVACVAALAPAAFAQNDASNQPQVPYLGVFGEDITADSGQRGAIIREVVVGSPADKAGLKRGDLVLKIGDQEINGFGDLSQKIRQYKPSDKVKVTVLRDGKEETLEIELGGRPGIPLGPNMPFDFTPDGFQFRFPRGGGQFPFEFPDGGQTREKRPMIGIQLQPVDDALRKQLELGDQQGTLVADVVDGSPADKAGIETTDLIVEADGKPVTNPEELSNLVASKKAGDKVILKIFRKGETMEKTVDVEEMSLTRTPRQFRMPERAEQFRRFMVPQERLEAMEKRINELEQQVKELRDQLKKD